MTFFGRCFELAESPSPMHAYAYRTKCDNVETKAGIIRNQSLVQIKISEDVLQKSGKG